MKKAVLVFMALVILATMPACATLFHSDRIGPMPQTARLDVGMLILDILLFLPGVIIDFCTGAIWIPVNNPGGGYDVVPVGEGCIGGQYYKNSETGEIIYMFPQKIDDNEKIQHIEYAPITG